MLQEAGYSRLLHRFQSSPAGKELTEALKRLDLVASAHLVAIHTASSLLVAKHRQDVLTPAEAATAAVRQEKSHKAVDGLQISLVADFSLVAGACHEIGTFQDGEMSRQG